MAFEIRRDKDEGMTPLPDELHKKFDEMKYEVLRSERDNFRDRLNNTFPSDAEVQAVIDAENPWAELHKLEQLPKNRNEGNERSAPRASKQSSNSSDFRVEQSEEVSLADEVPSLAKASLNGHVKEPQLPEGVDRGFMALFEQYGEGPEGNEAFLRAFSHWKVAVGISPSGLDSKISIDPKEVLSEKNYGRYLAFIAEEKRRGLSDE